MTLHSLLGVLFSLALLRTCYGQNNSCSRIEDIRLVHGTYGNFMGRVEVQYNGVWGTICDDGWSLNDARVACRMLGYASAGLALSRAPFGQGSYSTPIWITNLGCSGTEDCLDQCSYSGLGSRVRYCSHYEDAGIICRANTTFPPPAVIEMVNSSTTSITLRFNATPASAISTNANIRYRIGYSLLSRTINSYTYYYPSSGDTATEIVTSITNLLRDTEYSVQVGVDYRYRSISYSYITGTLSPPVVLRTNDTTRPTNISVRLISPNAGANFLGRVEVQYNGIWGTVCDDSFGSTDANLICRTLGFSHSLCVSSYARLGQGRGQIWLDNLACSTSAEVLEDCGHNGWGVHNCRHTDDVGVVCYPGNEFLGVVSNLTESRITPTSVTVTWEPYSFPSILGTYQYRISLDSRFSYRREYTVSSFASQYTLTGLTLGVAYNITIRLQASLTYCRYNTVYGNHSEPLEISTRETAPDGPPTSFHIVVLNSTAVEVQWSLPLSSLRNGIIRGYKLFVRRVGSSEEKIDFPIDNTDTLQTELVDNLNPGTAYVFSVLAYTTGVLEGTRSIHLTAQTYSEGSEPIISRFGVDGTGLDRLVRATWQRNVMVHCSTTRRNVQIDWFYGNGTKVGITDRNLREGHYDNGTTVLQIASTRSINFCDGGVYTCVANDTNAGKVERRNFTLIIGSTPARPNRPSPLKTKSSSITVGWEQAQCDGGHKIIEYNLQYYLTSRDIKTIPQIDTSIKNITVRDLFPSRVYTFRIQAVSSDFRTSSYSTSRFIVTLPPAPSPPRDVATKIVGTDVVEVRWRAPATPNGIISQYTIYLRPLSVAPIRGKRQSDEENSQVIRIVLPSTVTAANVTVPSTDVRYNVQVTASVQVGDEVNEGQLSAVTDVFVPNVGLPVAENVRVVNSTNSSITLDWDYPLPPFEPIEYFLVSYSSLIDWRSPLGNLVRFTESNQLKVDSSMTEVRVITLTPASTYYFRIAAVTTKGSGEEIVTIGQTDVTKDDERIAFMQIRIGPILSCLSFQRGNITERLNMFKSAFMKELKRMCSCDLTSAYFQNVAFSCASGFEQEVIFRTRILGTENYSAKDLVLLMQSWIESGNAAITVGSFRFQIDPSCPTNLDTLNTPDCPRTNHLPVSTPPTSKPVSTLPPTKESTTSQPKDSTDPKNTMKPSVSEASVSERVTSAGEIGMIVVGMLIALLLLGLIVLIVGLMFKKWRSNGTKVTRFGNGSSRGDDEDKTPFADMTDSARNSVLLESESTMAEKPSTSS